MNAEKPGLSLARLERYRQRLAVIARGTGDFAEPYRQALRWLEEEERRGLCWSESGDRRCRKPKGHDEGWHDDGNSSWPDESARCQAQVVGISCQLALGHKGHHKGQMRGRMGDRLLPASAEWGPEGYPFLSVQIEVPGELAGEPLRGLVAEPRPGWEAYQQARANLPTEGPPPGPYCGAEKASTMREGFTYRCVRLRGHEGPHNSGDGQWEDEACPVSWCSLPQGHPGAHHNDESESNDD